MALALLCLFLDDSEMIIDILVAAIRGAEMQSIMSVEAIADAGLVGDRYVVDKNRRATTTRSR